MDIAQQIRQIKDGMRSVPAGRWLPGHFMAIGYAESRYDDDPRQRADAIRALFTVPQPFIYPGDRIAGSIRPLFVEVDEEENARDAQILAGHPGRDFGQNADHYTPNYGRVMREGLPGMLQRIDRAAAAHRDRPERVRFLSAMRTTLEALQQRLLRYADAAQALRGTPGYADDDLTAIAEACRAVARRAPQTFAEALQLTWMIHTAFVCEGRYAMALGRMDRYLYPFYLADRAAGRLTDGQAEALLANALIKIDERRAYLGGDDVVNIVIGGVDGHGACSVNELSRLILRAVRDCRVPGPNLSARITPDTPDDFLDECLQVIGTGLGYPALMNDTVDRAALARYGYAQEDVDDYSMVGCIENFITGKQPPWSDGRFDTPRFLTYVFGNGISLDGKTRGVATGDVAGIGTMDEFMARFETQLLHGADEYMAAFRAHNEVPDPERRTAPFLSCFCDDCIGRGLDINMGGSVYPSVHGAALMGIGTTADSLAAIEQTVFIDRACTMTELRDALADNFVGHEALRQRLLAAPKYGNNEPLPDKYAVWFTRFLADAFARYRTRDGGGVYVAMAANTANIYAGQTIGATPDGRRAGEPLSDASSPTYGRDVNGPTTTLLSVSKPDYTRAACGSVLNQKFSPAMFTRENRKKLAALIRVFFARGGQEIQINATSPDVLRDAMAHPENYRDLVVRVSGFSAYYVTLDRAVQLDILARTQQS